MVYSKESVDNLRSRRFCLDGICSDTKNERAMQSGWRHDWYVPGAEEAAVVHEVVPGQFVQPQLVAASPIVLLGAPVGKRKCAPLLADLRQRGRCANLRTGIHDPWAEFLTFRGVARASNRVSPEEVDLWADQTYLAETVWQKWGLPLSQGIPDPWKNWPKTIGWRNTSKNVMIGGSAKYCYSPHSKSSNIDQSIDTQTAQNMLSYSGPHTNTVSCQPKHNAQCSSPDTTRRRRHHLYKFNCITKNSVLLNEVTSCHSKSQDKVEHLQEKSSRTYKSKRKKCSTSYCNQNDNYIISTRHNQFACLCTRRHNDQQPPIESKCMPCCKENHAKVGTNQIMDSVTESRLKYNPYRFSISEKLAPPKDVTDVGNLSFPKDQYKCLEHCKEQQCLCTYKRYRCTCNKSVTVTDPDIKHDQRGGLCRCSLNNDSNTSQKKTDACLCIKRKAELFERNTQMCACIAGSIKKQCACLSLQNKSAPTNYLKDESERKTCLCSSKRNLGLDNIQFANKAAIILCNDKSGRSSRGCGRLLYGPGRHWPLEIIGSVMIRSKSGNNRLPLYQMRPLKSFCKCKNVAYTHNKSCSCRQKHHHSFWNCPYLKQLKSKQPSTYYAVQPPHHNVLSTYHPAAGCACARTSVITCPTCKQTVTGRTSKNTTKLHSHQLIYAERSSENTNYGSWECPIHDFPANFAQHCTNCMHSCGPRLCPDTHNTQKEPRLICACKLSRNNKNESVTIESQTTHKTYMLDNIDKETHKVKPNSGSETHKGKSSTSDPEHIPEISRKEKRSDRKPRRNVSNMHPHLKFQKMKQINGINSSDSGEQGDNSATSLLNDSVTSVTFMTFMERQNKLNKYTLPRPDNENSGIKKKCLKNTTAQNVTPGGHREKLKDKASVTRATRCDRNTLFTNIDLGRNKHFVTDELQNNSKLMEVPRNIVTNSHKSLRKLGRPSQLDDDATYPPDHKQKFRKYKDADHIPPDTTALGNESDIKVTSIFRNPKSFIRDSDIIVLCPASISKEKENARAIEQVDDTSTRKLPLKTAKVQKRKRKLKNIKCSGETEPMGAILQNVVEADMKHNINSNITCSEEEIIAERDLINELNTELQIHGSAPIVNNTNGTQYTLDVCDSDSCYGRRLSNPEVNSTMSETNLSDSQFSSTLSTCTECIKSYNLKLNQISSNQDCLRNKHECNHVRKRCVPNEKWTTLPSPPLEKGTTHVGKMSSYSLKLPPNNSKVMFLLNEIDIGNKNSNTCAAEEQEQGRSSEDNAPTVISYVHEYPSPNEEENTKPEPQNLHTLTITATTQVKAIIPKKKLKNIAPKKHKILPTDDLMENVDPKPKTITQHIQRVTVIGPMVKQRPTHGASHLPSIFEKSSSEDSTHSEEHNRRLFSNRRPILRAVDKSVKFGLEQPGTKEATLLSSSEELLSNIVPDT